MRESELEILEQYPIEAESTRKIRGAFFINTKEGTMLLKETKSLTDVPSYFIRYYVSLKRVANMWTHRY